MKNYFNYDFENKAIIGSNAAIKRANKGNNKEYRELAKMLEKHPDFKVVLKEIDRKENKKTYNGLNFARMKEYILTQPDSENKMKVFEKVKEIAEAKGAKYPLTKKWFLETYPEYKENSASFTDAEAERIAAEELDEIENDINE